MKKSISILISLALLLTLVSTAVAETITQPSGAGSAKVYGPLTSYAAPEAAAWGSPFDAVATWKHTNWPGITGAQWISSAQETEPPYTVDTWRWFRHTIPLCTGAYDVTVAVTATADNAEEVYVNGVYVGGDGEVQGGFVDNHEWASIKTYNDSPADADQVVIDFVVRNYNGDNSATANPTGLIYNIVVNYSCPIEVDIDIKPGSDPSCFNSDGNGIIPVAILGSATFDVMDVNPETVYLEGAAVAVKGKSDKLLAAYEDINADGYMDLVVKIVDNDYYAKGSGTAKLEGYLYDGTPFFGIGDVCITQ